MSFLERQQKGPKRPPPSPSPSVTSVTSMAAGAGTTPTKKQKRDAAAPIYSQPVNTGFGNDLGTNMIYIVEFLKKEGKPKTLTEILSHMSLDKREEAFWRDVRDRLLAHTKVKFIPDPDQPADESAWRRGTYEHHPVLPGVKDEESLLAYLRGRRQAQGVSVKDIKDGWGDCEKTIERLEKEHKLLVVRTKKDNLARAVWIDDPNLSHDVDVEFKVMWHRVEVPAVEDIVRKLTQVGQKPTSEDPRLKIQSVERKQKQKKKSARRGVTQTNTHMAHILKDFPQK